jgi:hypothetical protein
MTPAMRSGHATSGFGGVIEGFYGRPWTETERFRLFQGMERWGLTEYLYAPKDDVRHRTRWRLPYDAPDRERFRRLVQRASSHGVRVIYGLGPGLDLEHGSVRDRKALQRKLGPLVETGIRRFALLFDDIAPTLKGQDPSRYRHVAEAQADFTNACLRWLLDQGLENPCLLFCPTPYCGRMEEEGVGGPGYLEILGKTLDPSVDVFWTGPEIISGRIDLAGIQRLTRQLRRPPVLWDNLHANDYDHRRLYMGPYSGRPEALRGKVRGILANPNCEWALNAVPLQTLGRFMDVRRPWNVADAYREAVADWARSSFQALKPGRIDVEDVAWLADCFHLPHSLGSRARRWLADLDQVLGQGADWTASGEGKRVLGRIRAVHAAWLDRFSRFTALSDRDLLYSFYRPLWELKEEVLLLERYLDWREREGNSSRPFRSGEHMPGTYRGGIGALLQARMRMHPDGHFEPSVSSGVSSGMSSGMSSGTVTRSGT